ncbi:MAG: plasmid stability protein [Bermanella sp.]|jgi:plasmid stability protein
MDSVKKESLTSNAFLLRFPDHSLKSKLQRRARLNGRSMNSEMLYILSKVLVTDEKNHEEQYQV